MSPEERKLLEEATLLSRENNQILKKMRRSIRIANLFSWLKWMIVIGVTIGTYYYFQPYLDKVLNLYGTVSSQLENWPKI